MISLLSDKPARLQFDTEWVDVKSSLSFQEFRTFFTEDKKTIDQLLPLLKKIVLNWSVVDLDGNATPVTAENIDKLTYSSVMDIGLAAIHLYNPDKKKSMPSDSESSGATETQMQGQK